MKSERLVPEKGKYDWSTADKFVEFGEQNGMVVHGHTLIWHSQTPRWFFKDDAGNEIDKDYAQIRRYWEPVVEITQIKGDSETHPVLSPEDSFSDFETYPYYRCFRFLHPQVKTFISRGTVTPLLDRLLSAAGKDRRVKRSGLP